MRRKTAAFTSAGALLVALAGGCTPAQQTSPQSPCAGLAATPAANAPRSPGAIAVLVDRSNSRRTPPGHQGDAGSYLPAAVDQAVENAAGEGRQVLVAGFDGGSLPVSKWRLVATLFPGDAGDRQAAQNQAVTCIENSVLPQAADQPPAAQGSDVVGALSEARDRLADQPGNRRILLVTDGLSNVGCSDMNRLAVEDFSAIPRMVASCRLGIDLPDLRGIRVDIVGVGAVGDGQARPDETQIRWLRGYWAALCQATGANGCTVTGPTPGEAGPNGNADSRTAPTTGGAVDPPIRYPQPMSDGTVYHLPELVVFATNSSELSPEAGPALDRAVSFIRAKGGQGVRVVGNTDSRGTDKYNLRLSRERAERVATELRHRGVQIAGVTSLGKNNPLPSCGPEYQGNRPDFRAMACDRRVDISVVTAR